MRSYKSKAQKQSEEFKVLERRRDSHTAFGRTAFNKNYWAQDKKSAAAAAKSARVESVPSIESDDPELDDEGGSNDEFELEPAASTAAAVGRQLQLRHGGDASTRDYDEAMDMKRNGGQLLIDFGEWLCSSQQSRNGATRRAGWLKVLSAYIHTIGKPDKHNSGQVWVSLRELNIQTTQTRYLNSTTDGARQELISVWLLLKQFGATFKLETPDVCLQNMKKTASFKTKKKASDLRQQSELEGGGNKKIKLTSIDLPLLRTQVLRETRVRKRNLEPRERERERVERERESLREISEQEC